MKKNKFLYVCIGTDAFSIVETIVAISVILVTALALAGIAGNAGRIVNRSARLNQAVEFSSSMLNHLLSHDYDNLHMHNAGGVLPAKDLPATSGLAVNYQGQRAYSIEYKNWDGTPAHSPNEDYKRLSVSTTYNDGIPYDIQYESIRRKP
jgi:type II secretory pathway pseudopilin PulG